MKSNVPALPIENLQDNCYIIFLLQSPLLKSEHSIKTGDGKKDIGQVLDSGQY